MSWTPFLLTLFMPVALWAHTSFFATMSSSLRGTRTPLDVATVACVVAGTTLTYTFDRVVEHLGERSGERSGEKQAVGEGNGVHHAAMRSTRFSSALLASSLLVLATFASAHVLWIAFQCVCICVWYSVPIPGVGRRLKDLFPFSKTVVVPLVHVYWPLACLRIPLSWNAQTVCLWFSVAASTVYMDVKDIHSDRRNGVWTFPNVLGHRRCLCALSVCYAAVSACLALVGGEEEGDFHTRALSANYAVHAGIMAVYACEEWTPTIRLCNLSWCLPFFFLYLCS